MRTTRLRTSLTTTVNTLAGLGERKSISSITPTDVNYNVNPVPAHPVDFNSTSLFGGFRSSGQKSRSIINHTSNVFSKQTNYRHSTQMVVRQPVRYYSTVPADVMAAVRNAPKTSYGGDNLSAYLRPQPTNDAEAQRDVPEFAYLVNSGTRFIWSAGIRLLAFKFLHSISASAEVLALATIEVDVSKIDPGKTITITWRGKPVFIKHRTAQEIEDIRNTPLTELKDPQRDEERVKDENWSVLLAICTHLGCVPVTDAGAYNAFFCPCHGSHYDASGRIRRGPAPLNLEVPKHSFAEGGKMIVLG